MLKKIFAVISEKDFENFRRRAYVEGMKIGEVFSALCHAYALGANIDLKNFKSKKEKEHHKPTGADYGGQKIISGEKTTT